MRRNQTESFSGLLTPSELNSAQALRAMQGLFGLGAGLSIGARAARASQVALSQQILNRQTRASLQGFNETIQRFSRSRRVRYFNGDRETALNLDQLPPGETLTVVIHENRLVIGRNIVGVDGRTGGSKSHETLMRHLNDPDPDFYGGEAGAIRFNANGSIDISGYHRKEISRNAADRIETLVREIFPNAQTRVTGDRLSTLPSGT